MVLIACKKDEIPVPDKVQSVKNLPMKNIINTTYVVEDAILYMQRQTGELEYYDHFGPNKITSTFDPFASSGLPIDSITKSVTAWAFLSDAHFLLNGNLVYPFERTYTGLRIYGLENGSARPFEMIRSTGDYYTIKLYESYVTINNVDYKYWTILTLRRNGYTGNVAREEIEYGAVYRGVINNIAVNYSTLQGTKWVITRYLSGINTTNPNDTLEFVSQNKYKINNGSLSYFSLSYLTGTGMRSLSLYNCTTLGGSYSGQVLDGFIIDGIVNNAEFTNLYNNNKVKVWMQRIQ